MNDQPPSTLPRVLGPWLATAIVVGCVIGTGVFKKGRAVSEATPETGLAIVAWVAVGLLTLCGALALSEVAALFPQAGGNFIYLREAYGRLFGFLWGWVEFWFIRCASAAAMAVVFAESFHDVLKLALDRTDTVLGFWERQGVAVTVCVLLAGVVARGTFLGATFQMVVTVAKLGLLVALMLLPVGILAFGLSTPTVPDPARFHPVWPADWSFATVAGLGTAMAAVLWPYNGWTNVAPIAGEVTNPQRNLPIAFVGGVLILIAVYVGVNVSYYLVVPAGEMAALKDRPVASEVCLRLLGPAGLLAASAAIMLSVFGSLGGGMLVGPRGVYAMSRDGLAPAVLGNLHPRWMTPVPATVAVATGTVLFILAAATYTTLTPGVTKDPFDVLTDFIVFGATSFETLAVGSIFVFRVTHPVSRVRLPYRCPLFPLVPLVYLLGMAAVLVNMLVEKRTESGIGLGFIAAGAVYYWVLYAKRSS